MNTLVRLYYLGAVIFSTRHIWSGSEAVARLPHEVFFGLLYAAFMPGTLIAGMIEHGKFSMPVVAVCGIGFWLALYWFASIIRPRPAAVLAPYPGPRIEILTRRRTIREEVEGD